MKIKKKGWSLRIRDLLKLIPKISGIIIYQSLNKNDDNFDALKNYDNF